MKHGIFESDRYMVEFDLLSKEVATNENLNSVIMSIIATAKVLSFPSLGKISDAIFKRLKEKYQYDDSVIRDFADCISGLRYYKARYQMECVKQHLPHVSRFCTSIMAQTKVSDAMMMDQRIKNSASKLLDEVTDNIESSEVELTNTKLLQLQAISSIAYKNNPIIEKAINKYAFEEKDINIEEIVKNFSK